MIKATEIWVPNTSRTALSLLAANYDAVPQLRQVSESKTFVFGSGLPGMAWAAGHPIVTHCESDEFQRGALALAAGISSVLAIPIFAGQFLTGVLTLLLSNGPQDTGAVEVWHCDLRKGYDLRLASGHFGQLKYFESIARHTSFRQGTGLPGRAWEEGAPVLMEDLGHARGFVRREGALRAGITTGVAFPVFHDPSQVYVVALLSSDSTPLWRQLEIWERDLTSDGLVFAAGKSVTGEDLRTVHAATRIAPREGPLGRCLFTGLPTLSLGPEAEGSSPTARGLSQLLAFPIIDAGRCRAVVALYN